MVGKWCEKHLSSRSKKSLKKIYFYFPQNVCQVEYLDYDFLLKLSPEEIQIRKCLKKILNKLLEGNDLK